jgi:hypothetical protein
MVQRKGEVVLRSICFAILKLKGAQYVPTTKNILRGSRIVQNPEHHVEIDSVGTRIICNAAGTCPTLHMNYNNKGELWYFIGARVSLVALVCAVTQGMATEDEEEVKQEMSVASRSSATKKRNTIGSSININNKEETFSGYLQVIRLQNLTKQQVKTQVRQETTNKR